MDDYRYMVENMILEAANIIRENRYLRKENERLKKVEEEYHQIITDRCREADEHSYNLLRAACTGLSLGKM